MQTHFIYKVTNKYINKIHEFTIITVMYQTLIVWPRTTEFPVLRLSAQKNSLRGTIKNAQTITKLESLPTPKLGTR